MGHPGSPDAARSSLVAPAMQTEAPSQALDMRLFWAYLEMQALLVQEGPGYPMRARLCRCRHPNGPWCPLPRLLRLDTLFFPIFESSGAFPLPSFLPVHALEQEEAEAVGASEEPRCSSLVSLCGGPPMPRSRATLSCLPRGEPGLGDSLASLRIPSFSWPLSVEVGGPGVAEVETKKMTNAATVNRTGTYHVAFSASRFSRVAALLQVVLRAHLLDYSPRIWAVARTPDWWTGRLLGGYLGCGWGGRKQTSWWRVAATWSQLDSAPPDAEAPRTPLQILNLPFAAADRTPSLPSTSSALSASPPFDLAAAADLPTFLSLSPAASPTKRAPSPAPHMPRPSPDTERAPSPAPHRPLAAVPPFLSPSWRPGLRFSSLHLSLFLFCSVSVLSRSPPPPAKTGRAARQLPIRDAFTMPFAIDEHPHGMPEPSLPFLLCPRGRFAALLFLFTERCSSSPSSSFAFPLPFVALQKNRSRVKSRRRPMIFLFP
nr:unnamed protein product [Digitaria exilis]